MSYVTTALTSKKLLKVVKNNSVFNLRIMNIFILVSPLSCALGYLHCNNKFTILINSTFFVNLAFNIVIILLK